MTPLENTPLEKRRPRNSPPFELRIELDGAVRTYSPGEPISGSVQVKVWEACRCRRLRLSLLWRIPGTRQRTVVQLPLDEGAWRSDRLLRYPFRLETPPGPPSYQGNSLAVNWYLRVEADVPALLGSRTYAQEEPLFLLPRVEKQPLATADAAGSWQRLLRLSELEPSKAPYVVFGLGCFLLPWVVAAGPRAVVLFLVILACSVGWRVFKAVRPDPDASKTGFLDLWLGAQGVAPGGRLPLRVKLQGARKDFELDHVSVTVQCDEVMSGGVELHVPLFSKQVLALPRQTLAAHNVLEFNSLEVSLPKDARGSFSVVGNGVYWYVRVELRRVIAETVLTAGNPRTWESIEQRTWEVPFHVSPRAHRRKASSK